MNATVKCVFDKKKSLKSKMCLSKGTDFRKFCKMIRDTKRFPSIAQYRGMNIPLKS